MYLTYEYTGKFDRGRNAASIPSTLSQRVFPADSQAINATHDWATDTAALAPSDSLEVLPLPPLKMPKNKKADPENGSEVCPDPSRPP